MTPTARPAIALLAFAILLANASLAAPGWSPPVTPLSKDTRGDSKVDARAEAAAASQRAATTAAQRKQRQEEGQGRKNQAISATAAKASTLQKLAATQVLDEVLCRKYGISIGYRNFTAKKAADALWARHNREGTPFPASLSHLAP
jgi:hypothetical protein